MSSSELEELRDKIKEERGRVEQSLNSVLAQESDIKKQLLRAQDEKAILLEASEETAKSEVMVFKKENKEYDIEVSLKKERQDMEKLKKSNDNKEN